MSEAFSLNILLVWHHCQDLTSVLDSWVLHENNSNHATTENILLSYWECHTVLLSYLGFICWQLCQSLPHKLFSTGLDCIRSLTKQFVFCHCAVPLSAYHTTVEISVFCNAVQMTFFQRAWQRKDGYLFYFIYLPEAGKALTLLLNCLLSGEEAINHHVAQKWLGQSFYDFWTSCVHATSKSARLTLIKVFLPVACHLSLNNTIKFLFK